VPRLTSMLALALLGAACTAETAPSTTTTPPPTSTITTTGPGRLAVVDDDGNIVVIDADGSNRVEVAAPGAGGQTFGQPIWSPDGSSVSWAQVGPDGFAYVIQGLESESRSEVAFAQYPFYAYWSPTGETLGVLRNGETGVVFELLKVGGATTSVVDSETPYYFSWSPEGDGLVAHAGAGVLTNRDDSGIEESSGRTSAGYLAPQWLEQGILHVDEEELVLETPAGDRTEVAEVGELTTFVANRQGTKIAIQTLSSDDAVSVSLAAAATIPFNSLVIVDIATGEVFTVHDGRAVAFFWSPNGESLLVLALNDSRDSLVPRVWRGEESKEYGPYAPSPVQVRDLFPFFPQYAQSLSFWSADSMSFVLVGAIGAESGVWVQDVDETDPRLVSGGSWAAWSP